MSKEFALAIVRANGTRWNVSLTTQSKPEVFVAKAGALGWLEKNVAAEHPVQAIVYRPGSDMIDECWFFEKGKPRRKLSIIADANVG